MHSKSIYFGITRGSQQGYNDYSQLPELTVLQIRYKLPFSVSLLSYKVLQLPHTLSWLVYSLQGKNIIVLFEFIKLHDTFNFMYSYRSHQTK